MIHQHIFASPKPGMSEEDFQRYWVEIHAVKYASKISQIKRYLIDTRINWKGEVENPIWSGIAEIWLRNEQEQLESLQSPEFLQGARLDEPNWAAFWNTLVLDTDSQDVLSGPELAPNGNRVKWVILNKRKAGMELSDYRNYVINTHSQLLITLPGLLKCKQCFTRDGWYAVGEPRFDGITQLWFEDVSAIDQILDTPEYKEGVLTDQSNVYELKYIFTMLTQEHWIIGPEARP